MNIVKAEIVDQEEKSEEASIGDKLWGEIGGRDHVGDNTYLGIL